MLRVLISTSTFPLRFGDGLPPFVYHLAEALSRLCDVTVLAPDAPGAARTESIGGVRTHRFTYFRPRDRQCLAYGFGMPHNIRASRLAKLQVAAYVYAQKRATAALVKRLRINIVNSHWMVPQGLTAALVRRSDQRYRHVLSVHSSDLSLLRRLPLGGTLSRFIVGHADRIFVSATNVRESLDKLLGRPSGAMVQPMGVHFDQFEGSGVESNDLPFKGRYLLFVGRLLEVKGVSYLLQALPGILRHQPELGLVVIGYGPLESSLREEVSRLGIEASVRFLGRQSSLRVAHYLRRSRVAVLPSVTDSDGYTEGMPTVVVEALAAGARVVACASGGIPDVIRHGENGWLCREKDPADLAEKILLALADTGRSQVSLEARKTAMALDWSKIADRYCSVFESVAESRQREVAR